MRLEHCVHYHYYVIIMLSSCLVPNPKTTKMQEEGKKAYVVREAPGIMQAFPTYEAAYDRFCIASIDAFHDVELYCITDDKYSLLGYHVGHHVKALLDIEDRIQDYNSKFAALYMKSEKKRGKGHCVIT